MDDPKPAGTIISLKDVEVFQDSNLILSQVNLNIDKGEFVFLVGKTGSGKSSLLRTLYADVSPAGGSAEICGYNLMKLKKRQIPFLRRKLGIVFQDFQLLPDRSVNDNLNFVLKATGWKKKDQIRTRVNYVLEKVGLDTKGFKMPHELSRALLNDPEVILADEPTGNLDPETSEGIINLLLEISKTGRSVVIATHDSNILSKFPARRIKCEMGKVIES
jgi:cell division transport system ATP-binding protein